MEEGRTALQVNNTHGKIDGGGAPWQDRPSVAGKAKL